MPTTESPLIIVENPTHRALPARTQPVQAIIVHTTGSGATWEQILKFYTAEDGYQPHYAIQLDGTIHRIADEKLIAWHCAIEPPEHSLYRQGYATWSRFSWSHTTNAPLDNGAEFSGYRVWRDRWREIQVDSPLDLPTGGSPNFVSVGIELEEPPDGQRTADIFTDAQYASLISLVGDVVQRHSVPVDRQHLLGHSDCSPMRRSTAHGGWDPGDAFNWTRLLEGVSPPADQPSAPQSPDPQSPVPQSPAPQSAAPQSPAPQSPAPQSAAPQSAAPQLAAPQLAAPQSAAPQSAAPQLATSQPAPQPSSPQPPAPQSALAATRPEPPPSGSGPVAPGDKPASDRGSS
jgi:hypothetical protein